MKRIIVCLAVLGTCATSSFAQSNVTLYGVIDVALRQVRNSNVGSMKSEQGAGQVNSSRLGFRGTEDLGSGLSAGFTLEASLGPDTGAAGAYTNTPTPAPAGQFFDRMSWINLKHTQFGEIRAGRDYTPAFWTVASYDPFGYISIGSVVALFSSVQSTPVNEAFGSSTVNANTLVRANNSISYILPAGLGGVYGTAMVAAGEGAANSTNGASKFYSARLGFARGPVDVSAAFATTKNTLVAGQAFKEAVFGGSYDFGVVQLMGNYTEIKYRNAKQGNLVLGANVPFGVSIVRLEYARANASGRTGGGVSIDANDATLIGVGYIYNLSKRTALFAHAGQISNKGKAAYTIAGGPAGMPGGGKSTAGEFGMRHSF